MLSVVVCVDAACIVSGRNDRYPNACYGLRVQIWDDDQNKWDAASVFCRITTSILKNIGLAVTTTEVMNGDDSCNF